ncbi:MAG: O-antigen ligase family protein [bacterium]|nr:O-antigen ligase family protein [bacterium]
MPNVKKILEFILLFLLPTQLGTFFFISDSIIHGIPIDLLAPALYATDILVIILVIITVIPHLMRDPGIVKKILNQVQDDKLVYVLISLFLILNIATSFSPLMSVYKLMKIAELGAVFWIIRSTKLNTKHILYAFLAMALVQLGLGLAQIISGHSLQGLFYFLGERSFAITTPGIAKVSLQGIELLRAYGTFPHPNALGGFYLLLYSFILFSPTLSSQTRFGIQKNLFLIISTLLIIFSFSKVAILGYVIVTVISVLRKKSACTWCRISGLLLPIALSGVFFIAQGDPESVDKRVWLITTSLMIIRDHLISGVGVGNYLIAQGVFPIPYSYHFLQPVHNIFLLLIAELGIPLFTLVVFLMAKFVIRNSKFEIQALPILFVIIFTGMFDHYWLTIQQNMLLVPVVFGLLTNNTKTV